MRRRAGLRLVAAAALLGAGLAAVPLRPAAAQPGTHVGSVNFSVPCTSELGVGVAYDGANLWYSCSWFTDTVDLHRANPTTGQVTASYSITGHGLGALAYDATRNALWAGWGKEDGGKIYLVQLDAGRNVVASGVAFDVGPHPIVANLDDGLAYDASDDTLYLSDDVSQAIHHYDTLGNHLADGPNGNGDFAWAGAGCFNSGLALGGDLLYEGSNGCSHVWVVNKATPSTLEFDFSTIIPTDPNFRDEDLECDPHTFLAQGLHVMWSMEAFEPRRAHAFEVPFGSCGLGGTPFGTTALADAYTVNLTVDGTPEPVRVRTLADARVGPSGGASSEIVEAVLPGGLGEVVVGRNQAEAAVPSVDPPQASASASATIVRASLLGGMVEAEAVRTASASSIGAGAASSTDVGTRLARLVIDGQEQVVPQQQATYPLPGGLGTVTLFEHLSAGDGSTFSELEVRALHLTATLPGGESADLVVASAYSGVTDGFTALTPRPPTTPAIEPDLAGLAQQAIDQAQEALGDWPGSVPNVPCPDACYAPLPGDQIDVPGLVYVSRSRFVFGDAQNGFSTSFTSISFPGGEVFVSDGISHSEFEGGGFSSSSDVKSVGVSAFTLVGGTAVGFSRSDSTSESEFGGCTSRSQADSTTVSGGAGLLLVGGFFFAGYDDFGSFFECGGAPSIDGRSRSVPLFIGGFTPLGGTFVSLTPAYTRDAVAGTATITLTGFVDVAGVPVVVGPVEVPLPVMPPV